MKQWCPSRLPYVEQTHPSEQIRKRPRFLPQTPGRPKAHILKHEWICYNTIKYQMIQDLNWDLCDHCYKWWWWWWWWHCLDQSEELIPHWLNIREALQNPSTGGGEDNDWTKNEKLIPQWHNDFISCQPHLNTSLRCWQKWTLILNLQSIYIYIHPVLMRQTRKEANDTRKVCRLIFYSISSVSYIHWIVMTGITSKEMKQRGLIQYQPPRKVKSGDKDE